MLTIHYWSYFHSVIYALNDSKFIYTSKTSVKDYWLVILLVLAAIQRAKFYNIQKHIDNNLNLIGGPVAPASGRGGNGVFPTGGRTTTSGRTFGTSTGGNGRPSGGQTTTFFGGRTIATNNNNNNFLRPQPGQFGSSTGGGSRPNPSTGGGSQPGRGGGRTLTIDPPCTSRFITDSRGRVIAGSCIRANQTNTTQVQASRFRRQVRIFASFFRIVFCWLFISNQNQV